MAARADRNSQRRAFRGRGWLSLLRGGGAVVVFAALVPSGCGGGGGGAPAPVAACPKPSGFYF